MDRKIIAISGEIQVGKSTLIEKLLKENTLPLAGFMTKLAREDGFKDGKGWPLYIYPAALPVEKRIKSPENLLGYPGRQRPLEFKEKFDTLCSSYLEDIPNGSLVIMDELGNLETASEKFMNLVFKTISGPNPVIYTIKARFEVPFLSRLKEIAGEDFVWVTKENRGDLVKKLIPVIKNWNNMYK